MSLPDPISVPLKQAATALVCGLLLVWGNAGNPIGLRHALIGAFLLVWCLDCFRNRAFLPHLPRWLTAGVLLLLIHTLLSALLSIDPRLGLTHWWHDFAAPLLLALAAAHFAPDLRLPWVAAAALAALAVNSLTDLAQVVLMPQNPTLWHGLFSDYGWENGFLLLTLPLCWGLWVYVRQVPARPSVYLTLPLLEGLALLACLSAWSRANTLCLVLTAVLTFSTLLCMQPWSLPQIRRLVARSVVIGVVAFVYDLALASRISIGVFSHFDLYWILTSTPLLLLLIPFRFRRQALAGVAAAVVALGCLGLVLLYQKASLKNTESDLVRRFSYREVLSDPGFHPFFGLGPGRDMVLKGKPDWHPRMQTHILPLLGEKNIPSELLETPAHGGHSHIQWINWRYEIGWVGLGLVLGLLGVSTWLFLRGLVLARLTPVTLGLGAALLAFNLDIPMGLNHAASLAQQHWLMWGLFAGLTCFHTTRAEDPAPALPERP
ncbi:MAG: hypothetical protein SFY92_04495 [Verrucomicrobiae bacterium]|nr:hypothetical protein [Verrucomicrobiae bacterium]